MKKIKVCVILASHWAAKMGGAQYQAKILVDQLISRDKFEVYYLARRVNEAFHPVGYEIVKIPGPAKVRPYRFFETSFSLLRILNKISPDVIYQQVGNAYTGVAAYYARHSKCKMVWRVSSDSSLMRKPIRFSPNLLYEAIDRAMMSYGIRKADAIIVQTPHQGNLLEKKYSRKPDAVVRNFHPYPKELPNKQLPIKILWIANFKALKQPELFLRLARDMAAFENTQFIMIGAPEKSRWFAKIQDEIESLNNLRYFGVLSQDDVNRVIAESHILVNTSQYEGFSNTFIQAWMRKVPVISLNVNPDDILNNFKVGFCAHGDYSRLLNYTKHLVINQPLLQEMADNARKYSYKYYSLRNVDQIVDILTV